VAKTGPPIPCRRSASGTAGVEEAAETPTLRAGPHECSKNSTIENGAPSASRQPIRATDAGVAALLSNLVSNVPAVMLFKPLIPALGEPDRAWLILAMATTLAGNLTLIGSVANIIVAEAARVAHVKLGFLEYARVGVPLTLATLLIGWLVLAI